MGSDQEAAERLCEAADLKPGDAAAYIFLGQMEKSTAAALPCSEERLARFAKQQPGNARANYYYALSLRKRERAAEHPEALRKSEMLLEKAVSIDPKFADAYLELGNFYFERAAITEAMGAYQKAIAAEPHMSQAHYQLSLAYRRSGEQAKAEREFQMYKQDQNTETAALERQRKEMRQFLVILKNEPASSPPR